MRIYMFLTRHIFEFAMKSFSFQPSTNGLRSQGGKFLKVVDVVSLMIINPSAEPLKTQ